MSIDADDSDEDDIISLDSVFSGGDDGTETEHVTSRTVNTHPAAATATVVDGSDDDSYDDLPIATTPAARSSHLSGRVETEGGEVSHKKRVLSKKDIF